MRTSKVVKSAAKIAAILLFITLLNSLCIFVLEPYGSKSQIMWTDYRAQKDLDTVYVGTSLTERTLDPNYIDEQLGTSSYNMCTPSQYLEESEDAMKTAIQDHGVKRVVIGLEPYSVMGEEASNPGRAFYRYKNESNPVRFVTDAAMLLTNDRLYKTPESINWLFPWMTNHVKTFDRLQGNVTMKLDGATVYEAAENNEPGWYYYGRGYGNYTSVFDKSTDSLDRYSRYCGGDDLSQTKLDILANMCDYCKQHNVQFIVLIPAFPSYNIFDYGERWFEQTAQIEEVVESHGGLCFDMNLAKPDFFDINNDEYWADFQHPNKAGGDAVSQAYVTLISRIEAGQETDSLFYTLDEYKQNINFVSATNLKGTYENGAIALKATAYAGWGSQVEYQFFAWRNSDETWVEVRGWGDDRMCEVTIDQLDGLGVSPTDKGQYKFRVNTRIVGNDAEYESYRIAKVTV